MYFIVLLYIYIYKYKYKYKQILNHTQTIILFNVFQLFKKPLLEIFEKRILSFHLFYRKQINV